MNLGELISEQREIKPNSLKAYLIALKKLNENKEIEDLKFLSNKSRVKEILEPLALSTKKNYLTAILVALPVVKGNNALIEYYREILEELNKKYMAEQLKQKKSPKQEENWLEQSELDKVRKELEKKVKDMDLKGRETINNRMFNTLQDLVIASLYTLLPPIRLDYSPMEVIKTRKQIKEGKNYLLNIGRNKKIFIIQEFKNVKSQGKKEIPISPKLNTLLNEFLKYNIEDYFLLNNRGTVLSPNGLGKAITRIFKPTGKQITINLLRHIFISNNVDMEALKKAENLAEQMHHSTSTQQNIYYKKE